MAIRHEQAIQVYRRAIDSGANAGPATRSRARSPGALLPVRPYAGSRSTRSRKGSGGSELITLVYAGGADRDLLLFAFDNSYTCASAPAAASVDHPPMRTPKNTPRHAALLAPLLLATNFAIVAAAPPQWHRVGKTGAIEIFIDRASIRYDRGTPLDKEGDRRKVHILYSHDATQKNLKGGSFRSETFVDEISCARRTVTTLSTVQFAGQRGDGAVVLRHNVGVRLAQPIKPSTFNEHIMETYVCDIE